MSEYGAEPDRPISDDMAEYLPVFMDETEEQLEGLTENLLVLEKQPGSIEHLNEAFRLIHSIKGSAGMMGLDSIAVLTHHLESHFERLRSGTEKLDEPMMNLVLRCIDFLRECVGRLRAGRRLGSSAELLQDLADLNDTENTPDRPDATATPEPIVSPSAPGPDHASGPEGSCRLLVRFEPDLPLVDLKARLILSRLSDIGDIISTRPSAAELDGIESLTELEVVLVTDRDADTIRKAADVDGAHTAEVGTSVAAPPDEPAARPEPEAEPDPEPEPEPETEPEDEPPADTPVAAPTPTPETAPDRNVESFGKAKSAETMRVDIDRLDSLMNLAGELVINRAHFVEVAGKVTPAFRGRNVTGRMRDLSESLRRTIDHLQTATNGEFGADIEELETGLGLLEEQAEAWNNGRRGFAEIGEAVDQLTRISNSLQQSVLATRMAQVAPLFNRFKRVVRDLATEGGKKVELVIRGEKTELDKRMIDELGDPLVHVVRNSIDHGLESPDVRRQRGKPEIGTIVLEASHRGNNVFIHIRDDGGGIDVSRIKSKIIERGLLGAAAADALTDAQAIDYIWHPGFSTAREVTDISGRGVGMDAVKTRVTNLNGTIEVTSTLEEGTTVAIRLPLTLAIINSLLIRVRDIVFSMPIDDVQEIVAVQPADVVTVHGKQTIDVRGEFLPLVGVDDIFDWGRIGTVDVPDHPSDGNSYAVILKSGERTMGLRVDELIGSQDIVIKSLSENFIDIVGLSGASILGDGNVCLMLDVVKIMDLAVRQAAGDHSA